MGEDGITTFINTIPFFNAFKDAEKQKLINRADCFLKFKKEDLVFKQEYNHDCVFLGMGCHRLHNEGYRSDREIFFDDFQGFQQFLGASTTLYRLQKPRKC